MDKKQKEIIKQQIEEATGMSVAKVHLVWSNGNKSRLYIGQDKDCFGNVVKSMGSDRRMVSVLIELGEDD